MKYKLGIRDAYNTFENAHDDAIQSQWLSKNPQEFWKAWCSKFTMKISATVPFPGCTTDAETANQFAEYFNKTFNDVRSAHRPTQLR